MSTVVSTEDALGMLVMAKFITHNAVSVSGLQAGALHSD